MLLNGAKNLEVSLWVLMVIVICLCCGQTPCFRQAARYHQGRAKQMYKPTTDRNPVHVQDEGEVRNSAEWDWDSAQQNNPKRQVWRQKAAF